MESKETTKKSWKQKMTTATDKLAEYGGRVAGNKYLGSIRDAFATILPLVIVGALGVLINEVFIKPNGLIGTAVDAENNPIWIQFSFYVSPIFTGIAGVATSIFSLYIAFLIAYFLAIHSGKNPVIVGALSLGAFMTLQPFAAGPDYLRWIRTDGVSVFGTQSFFLGVNGIMVGMLVGLTVPAIYNKFSSYERLKIKMPEGVPPMVANAFNALIPVALTLLCFGLIQPIWGMIAWSTGIGIGANIDGSQSRTFSSFYWIFGAIYSAIALPLMDIAQTPAVIFLVSAMICMFWFVGVSGSSVFAPILFPIYEANGLANIDNFLLNGALPEYVNGTWQWANLPGVTVNIWTKQAFDSFVNMGGSGTTISMILLIFFTSRSRLHNQISKVAAAPGFFNINEPVTFGLPIVLNPLYIIPFMLAPASISLTAFYAISLGLVNPTVGQIPWVTPLFISGFISTLDWRSIILTALNLGIAIAFYLPFILADMKTLNKKTPENVANLTPFQAYVIPKYRKQRKQEKEQGKVDDLANKELIENIEKTSKSVTKHGGKKLSKNSLDFIEKKAGIKKTTSSKKKPSKKENKKSSKK